MPVLFVSLRSLDDALVDDLATWLTANGFTDHFIDHRSIRGGEKWADALQKSAGACRVASAERLRRISRTGASFQFISRSGCLQLD